MTEGSVEWTARQEVFYVIAEWLNVDQEWLEHVAKRNANVPMHGACGCSYSDEDLTYCDEWKAHKAKADPDYAEQLRRSEELKAKMDASWQDHQQRLANLERQGLLP